MRILVVDDSPIMRRIIANALGEIGYSEVEEASDGEEALQKLNGDSFDFLLTDWNMPNMNGLTLTKTVREHPSLSKLPILMVTTRGMKDDVVEALKAKVDNYVVKPFTSDVLRAKIDQVLKN